MRGPFEVKSTWRRLYPGARVLHRIDLALPMVKNAAEENRSLAPEYLLSGLIPAHHCSFEVDFDKVCSVAGKKIKVQVSTFFPLLASF